jgi:hypothetical protein
MVLDVMDGEFCMGALSAVVSNVDGETITEETRIRLEEFPLKGDSSVVATIIGVFEHRCSGCVSNKMDEVFEMFGSMPKFLKCHRNWAWEVFAYDYSIDRHDTECYRLWVRPKYELDD